jgi:hypothetical protein
VVPGTLRPLLQTGAARQSEGTAIAISTTGLAARCVFWLRGSCGLLPLLLSACHISLKTRCRDYQLRSCKDLLSGGVNVMSLNFTANPCRSGVQHITPTFTFPAGKGHKRSNGQLRPSVEYCRRRASSLRVRRSQNSRGLPGKTPSPSRNSPVSARCR